MASLEEIRVLEQSKKDELLRARRGDEFDPGHFEPQQLGLSPVMVDRAGRLWNVGSKPWKLLPSFNF